MWIKRVQKTILDNVKGWSNIMEKKEGMKCVVSSCYGDVVMAPEDALTLLEIYSRAEKYEHHTNYTTKEESHHVWDILSLVSVKSISTALYQCAKLAGKREEK
jgi:hypothetical protein